MSDTRKLTYNEIQDLKDWAERNYQKTPNVPEYLTVKNRETFVRDWLHKHNLPEPLPNLAARLPALRAADTKAADLPPVAKDPATAWEDPPVRPVRRQPAPAPVQAAPPQPEPPAPEPQRIRPATAPPARPQPARKSKGRPLSYHERFLRRLEQWYAKGGSAGGPLPADNPEWTDPTAPPAEHRGARRFASIEQLSEERRRRREQRIKDLEQERNLRMEKLNEFLPRLGQIQHEQQMLGLTMVRSLLNRAAAVDPAGMQKRGAALSAERNELLAAYRIDPKALEVDWDCPHCQNTGWLPARPAPTPPGEPERYYPADKCDCLRQEELADLFRAAGLQGPQQERTFANFSLDVYPEERRPAIALVLERCRDFAWDLVAGEQRDSLLIMGEPGGGKTHLACAIAHEVVEARQTAVYLTMNDFLEIVRMRSLDLNEESRDYVRLILNADLLVLDDLGAEKLTEFSLQELMMLLNHRLNNGLPLVVTTNLTEEEIQRYYFARIYSRLVNGCEVCTLDAGVDVRAVLRRSAGRVHA